MVKIPKGSEIVNKVLNKADAIGTVLSFVGNLGGVVEAGHHISRIIVAPRTPDFGHIMSKAADHLWFSAPLVLGGLLLESLDIESANKYARAIMKFGVGNAIGGLLAAAVESSHNPQPGSGSLSSYAPRGSSKSPVWRQTTSRGPVTTSARKLQVTASQPVSLPSM